MKALLFLLFTCVGIIHGQRSPDRQFVEDFWNGLQNKAALGWDMTMSVCGQKGINCASQRITRINFSNFKLLATLPESLGLLSELQQLNGEGNRFFGSVPESLKGLNKCNQIILFDNDLSGIFPSSIFNATILQRVHIQNNFFTGESSLLVFSRTNQLLMANNSFFCPIADYSSLRVHDYNNARSLCNNVCPPHLPNLCPQGTYCTSSGKGSLSRSCVTPLPCEQDGSFPLTPGGFNATILNCPANSYGKSTRFCFGQNIWFDSDTDCRACPQGSTSSAGSSSYEDCICQPGFTLTPSGCIDTNECEILNPCHSNASCVNTPGSFSCSCKDGFLGDGYDCQDIDECSTPNLCGQIGQCENTLGSFSCICPPGSSFNGIDCVDIDECSLTPSVCPTDSQCFNLDPFYFCTCNVGYVFTNFQCVPGPRLQSTIGFEPLAIWNFDYVEYPVYDFTGNQNGISLESNAVVPFYSKNNPQNRAIFLARSRLVTTNTISFDDNYAIEVIFNVATLIETDFISLFPGTAYDPSIAPLRIRMTDTRRFQLFNRLTLIGTSSSSYTLGITNYLIVSAQRTQIVLFLNGVQIGTFRTVPESGNFNLQIGSRFRGYVDEVTVLGLPIFGRDAPFRDDLIQCDTICPAGQVCVNKFDGVFCQ